MLKHVNMSILSHKSHISIQHKVLVLAETGGKLLEGACLLQELHHRYSSASPSLFTMWRRK